MRAVATDLLLFGTMSINKSRCRPSRKRPYRQNINWRVCSKEIDSGYKESHRKQKHPINASVKFMTIIDKNQTQIRYADMVTDSDRYKIKKTDRVFMDEDNEITSDPDHEPPYPVPFACDIALLLRRARTSEQCQRSQRQLGVITLSHLGILRMVNMVFCDTPARPPSSWSCLPG